jgi:hypothetical protein
MSYYGTLACACSLAAVTASETSCVAAQCAFGIIVILQRLRSRPSYHSFQQQQVYCAVFVVTFSAQRADIPAADIMQAVVLFIVCRSRGQLGLLRRPVLHRGLQLRQRQPDVLLL